MSKFKINTVAELIHTDNNENGSYFHSNLLFNMERELPMYDYDMHSEYYYSDFAANAMCFCDGHWDEGIEGEELEEFLLQDWVKEYLLAQLDENFTNTAEKYLKAKGIEIKYPVI